MQARALMEGRKERGCADKVCDICEKDGESVSRKGEREKKLPRVVAKKKRSSLQEEEEGGGGGGGGGGGIKRRRRRRRKNKKKKKKKRRKTLNRKKIFYGIALSPTTYNKPFLAIFGIHKQGTTIAHKFFLLLCFRYLLCM